MKRVLIFGLVVLASCGKPAPSIEGKWYLESEWNPVELEIRSDKTMTLGEKTGTWSKTDDARLIFEVKGEKPTVFEVEITDRFLFLTTEKVSTSRFKRAGASADDQKVAEKRKLDRNERMASASLKTMATAQADFRSNDRDNDRAQNFWVGDVHGLFGMCPSTNGSAPPGAASTAHELMIKLIEHSIAAADAAPLSLPGIVAPAATPVPKSGYFFQVVKSYKRGDGQTVAYGQAGGIPKWGEHWNFGKFAICAYPAQYGVTGRRTYFMNEDITIWWKDTGGQPVAVAPVHPGADGWMKLD